LSVIGGKTLGEAVAGIMKFLLNVSVQRRYNWSGQKGKKKLGSLKLATVIFSKYKDIKYYNVCCSLLPRFLHLVGIDQPVSLRFCFCNIGLHYIFIFGHPGKV